MPIARLPRRGRLGFLLLLLALVLPPVAAATERHEGLAEESIAIPAMVRSDGALRPVRLTAYLARPEGPGPFPVVLLSHGAPRMASDRARMRPDGVGRQARDFARRGWAAVAVSRRGYGESDGPFVEDAGRCEARDYLYAGRTSGEDLRGALGWVTAQRWADAKRVLLVGVSAGGFASTALAAEPPPGIVGIVSFAGGRGSRAANDVCQPERLVAAFGTFGSTARAPALWIYSENDLFFGPELARQMHAAYVAGGAPADLVMEPPFGEDGHSLYAGAQSRWWPIVDAFLRRQNLPTWSPAALALNGAGNGDGRLQEAFDRYLAGPGEKAMAIAETGAFGWVTGRSTTDQARAEALDFCRRNTNALCRLRFVNLAPAP